MLPKDTATFVFTDIEGSTQLLQQWPEEFQILSVTAHMREALNIPIQQSQEIEMDACTQELNLRIGEADFGKYWNGSRSYSLETLMDTFLNVLAASPVSGSMD